MKKKINQVIYFIIPFVILVFMLLSYYPGLVSYDGNNQWEQVQNGIITNSHPFFSTFFMFLLSKIWNSITVVVIYQIILVSISWGYFCTLIKTENKKRRIFIYIYSVLIMFLPLTSLYSITVWKDIIYTSYLFMCCVVLYEWAINNYKLSKYKYILLGFLLTMIFSYRHNGIIVAIVLLVLFYIISYKKYKIKIINKKDFKKSFIVILTFALLLISISIPKRIFLEKSKSSVETNSENSSILSVADGYMLWMMGAHIKDDNIDNKRDIEFLNKIIPIEEWKRAYNPYLINNTNSLEILDKEYMVKNIVKFRKMFIKYSLKKPLAIIKHYLKSDALLFNPISSINGYVYVFCFPELQYLPKYTEINSKIPFIKKIYNKITDYSFHKPFIIFYQPAFILYLSLILTIFLSKKYLGKKIWLFVLPMIANTLSLAPINLAQDLRYVYINYFVFYGLVLMYIVNFKKKKLL